MEKTKQVLPAKVTNPDGTVLITLKVPVQYGEEQIEQIKINRPKAKHLKGFNLSKPTPDDMLGLLSRLSGQFPQALDELELEDYFYCLEVINDFLPVTVKDGKTA